MFGRASSTTASRPTASGTTLVVAIGLTAICVSLAFACLYVGRSAVDTATEGTLQRFARTSARAGSAHAMAVLLDSYARSPRVPSHYRFPNQVGNDLTSSWNTGFRAIDSYKAGWDTAINSDNEAKGRLGTPYDSNGNDVNADMTLLEVYSQTDRGGITDGQMRTSTLGRWIEPGCYDSDLVGKPVSFHLTHPQPANAASPDPAIRAGENWTPDVNRPLYYDSDFQPLGVGATGAALDAARAAARYRLRYAVAIEDLSGHLFINFPGTYSKPVNNPATGGTVTAADDNGAREIDKALVDEWIDPFSSLVMSTQAGAYEWTLGYMARGMGAQQYGQGENPIGGGVGITKFVAGRPVVLNDYDQSLSSIPAGEPDGFYDTDAPPWFSQPASAYLHCYVGGRGPTLSYEVIGAAAGQQRRSNAFACYTYSPYGRGTKKVAAPTTWDEGYTSCPWRINIPTMTPQVLLQMVYAHLPVEPRSYLYQHKTISDYVGDFADGSPNFAFNSVVDPDLPGWTVVHAGSKLRNVLPVATSPFAWHVPNPYPGMDPSTPGPDWNPDLGKDIHISNEFVKSSPLFGDGMLMFLVGPWHLIEKADRFPGGQMIDHSPGAANFYSITPGNAYLYPNSYWQDVNVAMIHTLMSSMLAWHGETGASWGGAPTLGAVTWPIGHRLTTQPPPCLNPPGGPAPAVAMPVIDADANGDGVNESPSQLDSVEKVDRLFITNMGEYWGDFATGTRPMVPSTGVYCDTDSSHPNYDQPMLWWPQRMIRKLYAPPATSLDRNIKMMSAAPTPLSGANMREMELVLNDTRMSFFGASPQYPNFQGIDFDDDGIVWCSAYPNGNVPADPTSGKGRVIDPALGDKRWSLSGYFVFQQSHFFRAFVRGEVFDEYKQRPVAQADLESVFAIDPDGSLYDVMGAPKPAWNANPAQCTGLGDSQVLFQRWHHLINKSTLTEVTPLITK